MIDLSANVDESTLSDFCKALGDYQKNINKDSRNAPRIAAIDICKSLRARTKVAKKNKGMSAVISAESPQWITYKDRKKLSKPLRRWRVTLTDRGKTFTRYVYAGTRAEMMKEIRAQVGKNYYPEERRGGVRGLAKRSWGWVMHNIYSGAAPDTPWKRRKNDRRNPKYATIESMSRPWIAYICNRLEYATDALKGGDSSISDAISAATNKMIKRIETRNFGRN